MSLVAMSWRHRINLETSGVHFPYTRYNGGMKIVLFGHVPSKKNSKRIFVNGGRPRVLPSEIHEAWEEEQLLALRRFQRFSGPCQIEITVYAPNRRRGDLDNKASSILDLLCKAGTIQDDNCEIVRELHLFYGGVDKAKPRAEIEIVPC